MRTVLLTTACAALARAATISTANISTSKAASPWPYQTFITEPTFFPPVLKHEKTGPTEPGYLFFSPQKTNGVETSVIIMTDEGDLVWQLPDDSQTTIHLQMATYKGQDVLMYWGGTKIKEGEAWGSTYIMDTSYNPMYHITLNFERATEDTTDYESYMSVHEAWITRNNTLMVMGNNVTRADLTSVGGPAQGWITDSLLFEMDIEENKILWSWSALAHQDRIPLTSSYNHIHPIDNRTGSSFEYPWDFFHMNSAMDYTMPDSDVYIVSARYTCAVYFIEKSTGYVKYVLDGVTGGDFAVDHNTWGEFMYQHHARVLQHDATSMVMTLHNNNESLVLAHNITTGMQIHLDFAAMTAATVANIWDPAHPVFAAAMGSYQTLNNSHVLLNHGLWPEMFEYDAHGAAVYRAQYGEYPIVSSYRAYRYPFVGRPNTPPVLAACAMPGGGTKVAMSWNGATEVSTWDVYGCHGNGTGAVRVASHGFETTAALQCAGELWAEAIDHAGNKTKTATMSLGNSRLVACS